MARSVSYLMSYSRRPTGSEDSVGGLPTHLPYHWPHCQGCQLGTQLAFVGQLYAKDWWPLDGHLAVQLYVCDGCRRTAPPPKNGSTRDRGFGGVPTALHLEFLPTTAATNTKAIGVRCRFQPKRFIRYTPVEDSMDQRELHRRKLSEEELPDKHLRLDKLGGLFPYDDEAVKMTKQNMMIGQLGWQHWQGFGFGGTVYLYRSTRVGIYPLLYS